MASAHLVGLGFRAYYSIENYGAASDLALIMER